MLILGFPTMVSGQWKVNKTVDDKYTINTQLNLLNRKQQLHPPWGPLAL